MPRKTRSAKKEELQAANEELASSKLELQAMNEELSAVNRKLQDKVEELRQASSDMENLLRTSETASLFLDRQLAIKGFTPAAATIYNLGAADVGRPFRQLGVRRALPSVLREALRVLAGETCDEQEVTTLGDGQCYLQRISPYRGTAGEIVGVVVTLVDITARKQVEARILRQHKVSAGINRIFAAVIGSPSEEEFGRVSLAVIEELTESSGSFLGELGADGKLHYLAMSDPGWALCTMAPSRDGRRRPFNVTVHGLYGRVIQDGLSFFTNDPANHPDRVGVPPGHPPLTAFLGVPLLSGGQTVGMIGVANRAGGYSSGEAELLTDLAVAIGEALRRLRAERELRESRYLLQAVVDAASDAIFVKDTNGRYLLFNEAAARITGVKAAEVVGRDDTAVFAPANARQIMAVDQGIMEGTGPQTFEDVVTMASGGSVAVQVTKGPLRDPQGKVWGLFGISRDITERKEAEAALQQAAEQSRLAMDAAELGAWDFQFSTDLVFWDERCRAMFGVVSDRRLDYEQVLACLHPDDRSGVEQAVQQALAGADGGAYHRQFRVVWPDQTVHWLDSHGRVYFGWEGNQRRPLRFVGVNREITAERQAQEAIGESQRQNAFLGQIIEFSSQAFGVSYPDGRLGLTNSAFEYLTGYSREELRALKWDSVLTPPEWWEREREKLAELQRLGLPVRYEKEYLSKDGRRVPVEMLTHIAYDPQGQPWYYYSFITDIRERKKAEAERARLLSELQRQAVELDTVFQALPYPVSVHGGDGRYKRANPAAIELLGFNPVGASREEVAERVQACFPDGVPFTSETIPSARALRGEPVRGVEYRLTNARGEDHVLLVNAVPLVEAGKVQGMVIAQTDITDRKAAEQALRQSEQRVRQKLASVLAPEGEWQHLELADIVAVEEIQALMEQFYHLAQIPMGIVDGRNRILVQVGWQEICTRFHRVHPESSQFCLESERHLADGISPGEFRLYQCKNHLWDVATPVVVGGNQVGQLILGQFFLEENEPDPEFFRAQARRFGFPEEEYLAALARVPRISRAAMETGMTFCMQLTNQISKLSYSNIKLARSLAEQERLLAELNRSENRYRSLFMAMSEGFYLARILYDEQGQPDDYRFLEVNPAFAEIIGMAREEIVGKRVTEVVPAVSANWMAIFVQVATTGKPIQYDFYSQPFQRHFETFAFRPAADQFAVLLSDITVRKQAEERIQASLSEKEVLLKEVHHRVKNNLQVISSLVSLQAAGLQDPALVGVFQDIQDRVRSMALVHEKLYQSDNFARVEFAEYARSLLQYLWRAHGEAAGAVRLELELEPLLLSVETAVPCGLLLNELTVNALKHAFPNRRPGVVTVRLHQHLGGGVSLGVGDNGCGMPPGFDWRQSTSLGLRLVQILAAQIGGTVEVDGVGGTEFLIAFAGPDGGAERGRNE